MRLRVSELVRRRGRGTERRAKQQLLRRAIGRGETGTLAVVAYRRSEQRVVTAAVVGAVAGLQHERARRFGACVAIGTLVEREAAPIFGCHASHGKRVVDMSDEHDVDSHDGSKLALLECQRVARDRRAHQPG